MDTALPPLHPHNSLSSRSSRRPTGRFGEAEVILRVNPSCEHQLNTRLQRLTDECGRVARQLEAKRRKFIEVQLRKQRRLEDGGVTGVSLIRPIAPASWLGLPHVMSPKEVGTESRRRIAVTKTVDDDGCGLSAPELIGGGDGILARETMLEHGLSARQGLNYSHPWTADDGRPTGGDDCLHDSARPLTPDEWSSRAKRHSWQFGVEFTDQLQSCSTKTDAVTAATSHQLLKPSSIALAQTGDSTSVSRFRGRRGNGADVQAPIGGSKQLPQLAADTAMLMASSEQNVNDAVHRSSPEGDPRFVLLIASLHRRLSCSKAVSRRPSRRTLISNALDSDLELTS